MAKMWIVFSPALDLNYFDNYQDALKEYEDSKEYLMAEGHEPDTQVFLLESVKVATSVVDEEKTKAEGIPKNSGYDFNNWAKWEEE